MKAKVYLRIAKTPKTGKIQVRATAKPTTEPITDSQNRSLPTVGFALKLEIPDLAFDLFRREAVLEIPEEALEPIVAEILDPPQN